MVQKKNNGQRISNHIHLRPGCLTGAFPGFANTRPWISSGACGRRQGPRASEQSRIYPPWSKSIISEQCNSTLITACHKISYSDTRTGKTAHTHWRLCTHPPVRLSLTQPALFIPLWTDGGIHPWCGYEGRGWQKDARKKRSCVYKPSTGR